MDSAEIRRAAQEGGADVWDLLVAASTIGREIDRVMPNSQTAAAILAVVVEAAQQGAEGRGYDLHVIGDPETEGTVLGAVVRPRAKGERR